MVTDPIADFLIRIKNANQAGKSVVSTPASSLNEALAALLQKEGYIAGSSKKPKSRILEITLKYSGERPAVSGVRRISKPSRRLYMGVRDIRPVRRGHGLLVLSTPKGLLTGAGAKRERVGGEALFELW